MANAEVAKKAGNACKYLEMSAAAVAVVGVLLAIGAVVFGFLVDEPWTYGPIAATEDWHSIVTGIIVGIVTLVQTLVVYSVLVFLDFKAEKYIYENIAPTPTDAA